MKVHLIAQTVFHGAPAGVPWKADEDANGGEALAEFAGRACYQSWSKPNPATATNAGYLRHIIEVGHLSVLEHGTVTFYLEGISRSLTHELIRHRHFSYSQLSQRYVDASSAEFIPPPVIAGNAYLTEIFNSEMTTVLDAYESFAALLAEEFPGATRKAIRQAARAVLPNATETKIVVTGNYRAWRHFIGMRATEHADVEIRELAIECLRRLQGVAPSVFADFTISPLPDGTEIAETYLATDPAA